MTNGAERLHARHAKHVLDMRDFGCEGLLALDVTRGGRLGTWLEWRLVG